MPHLLSLVSLSKASRLNILRIRLRTRFPYRSSSSLAFRLVVPCVGIAVCRRQLVPGQDHLSHDVTVLSEMPAHGLDAQVRSKQ